MPLYPLSYMIYKGSYMINPYEGTSLIHEITLFYIRIHGLYMDLYDLPT